MKEPDAYWDIWSWKEFDDPLNEVIDIRDLEEEKRLDEWARAIEDGTDGACNDSVTVKLERKWLAKGWEGMSEF